MEVLIQILFQIGTIQNTMLFLLVVGTWYNFMTVLCSFCIYIIGEEFYIFSLIAPPDNPDYFIAHGVHGKLRLKPVVWNAVSAIFYKR